MPTGDILDENVIIKSIDLSKRNYNDLSTFKIMLPKEGVFVVLKWLYPDKECCKNLHTSLSAILTEPSNIVWFSFRDKVWSKDKRPRLPKGNYMTLKVGLKVTF